MSLLLLCGPARAEVHCRPIEGGSQRLGTIDAEERLNYLRVRLGAGARKARTWTAIWATLYSGIVITEGVWALASTTRDDRIDHGVGAGAAFIGVAVIGILPLKVMGDQRWLERRLKRAHPDEDRCALLADAERLLLRGADGEAFGRGPLVHVGNLLFNAGLGILLGVGFGHWNQAAITALSGVVVGEVQALSQPHDEVTTLARYRQGSFGPYEGKPPPAWLLVPTAARDRVGLQLALQF